MTGAPVAAEAPAAVKAALTVWAAVVPVVGNAGVRVHTSAARSTNFCVATISTTAVGGIPGTRAVAFVGVYWVRVDLGYPTEDRSTTSL
jgi:hypothetical protein